jgi:hypothetical protein
MFQAWQERWLETARAIPAARAATFEGSRERAPAYGL